MRILRIIGMRISRFCMRFLHAARLLMRKILRGGGESRNVRIMLVRDGRVVLVRHVYAPWVWTLPGGTVERNESDADTARREAREETGFEIDAIDGEVGIYDRTIFGMGDRVCVLFTEHFGGTMRLLPDAEILQRGSFHMNELPETISPKTKRILEAFTRGVRKERGVW